MFLRALTLLLLTLGVTLANAPVDASSGHPAGSPVGVMPFLTAAPTAGAARNSAIQSASSPGHVDYEDIVRIPDGYDPVAAGDKVVFTGDIGAGIGISVSGADLHDIWVWKAYARF